MEAQIKCPHCGHTHPLTPEQVPQYAGQTITCANCRQAFTVPANLGAPTQASVPPRPTPLPRGIPPAFPQTQAYSQYVPPPQRGGNGLAIASIVCGILGYIIPFIGGIVGLILGIRALNKKRKSGRPGKKLAIAGINVSAVSILVCLLVLPSALSRARERANRIRCASEL